MSNRKNIPAETRNIVMVPLGNLKKSPNNVRKVPHTGAEIAALAASMSSVGMLQYPVVEPERGPKDKPTGNYLVNAGEGRRLALVLRAQRDEIAKDELVPCILDTEHNATEISLAENAMRTGMHPADEYEAFAELHNNQGMSIEDIAARFGVTAAVVKQRLKLGAVSPVLLTLYREGGMDLEQLMAFAITDNHARQEQVWKELGWDRSRRAILRALTEGQVSSNDRRVTFIGLEAYEAAGGAVIRDLFDARGGGYLADAALLNNLVREKLQLVAEPVLAEGWKWVVVEAEFPYKQVAGMATLDTVPRTLTEDQQHQLAALQEELELISSEAEQDEPSEESLAEIERLETEIARLTEDVHAPDDIARAGVFVALGHNGEVRIERGYLRPEDERGKGEGVQDGEDAKAIDMPVGLSAVLIAELTTHRTAALRNDLGQASELALIAVTHALAAETFYRRAGLSCLGLSVNQTSLASTASAIEESVAGKAVADRHAAWAARLPKDGEALWPFVASLSMDGLLSLLAHCASLSLDVVQRPGSPSRDAALAHAEALAKAMPFEMTRYWQPTAASYLGRVTKERILDAVREGAGENAARQIAGLKKQAMAQRAEVLLAGKGWLPGLLRPAVPNEAQASV